MVGSKVRVYTELYPFTNTTISTSITTSPKITWRTTKSSTPLFLGSSQTPGPFTLPEEETTQTAANTEQEETTTLLTAEVAWQGY